MSVNRILMVGNGFNLVSDGGASWNALLNKLAGTPATSHEEEIRSAKPFTLWFEEIASRGNYRDLKASIVKHLKDGVMPNKHHEELMALDFRNILTTNYDYNLEVASGVRWKSNFSAHESYYSIFRRRSTTDYRNIWHIHGELDNLGSIMLGHEQYSGYIQKIRNFMTTGVETSAKARNGKPYLSKYSRKSIDSRIDVESWVDLFLEHEVHIIGFSLDYTENHLWNLLTTKQRLKRQGNSISHTIFHRCSNKTQSTTEEAKYSILSAFGVQVIDHRGESYSAAYDACIDSLR